MSIYFQILEQFSEFLEPEIKVLLRLCNAGKVKDFLEHFLEFLEFVPTNVFVDASQAFFGSIDAKLEVNVLENLEREENCYCASNRSCLCKQHELRQGLAQLSCKILDSLIGATIVRLEEHLL